MRFSSLQSDEAVLGELGARLAQLRIARNLTQAALSEAAGLSKRTLERIEDGGSVQLTNLVRLMRALDLVEGLEALFPEQPPSPIDELRRQAQRRRRASATRTGNRPTTWKWGDER